MRNHMRAGRFTALTATMALVLLGLVACGPGVSPVPPLNSEPPSSTTSESSTSSYFLPRPGSSALPPDAPTGRMPSAVGTVDIEGLGTFTFDPREIETTRPDLFAAGHFSVFDVVAHLAGQDWFTMKYHYDPALDTNIIDELDGRTGWWYQAYYGSGWPEIDAYRMDMYPYQDGLVIRLMTQPEEYLGRLYNSFAEEILRKSVNRGRVLIPQVRIGTRVHVNVPVSAHDIRADVLQPGTVTALDVLLSLADQKKIRELKLTWYSDMGDGAPFDSYHVEQIDDEDGEYDREASADSGGWVYETGSLNFAGYNGSHLQIPADVRIIVSPDYMTWYWLGKVD